MAHLQPEFYLQMGKSFNISVNFMFFFVIRDDPSRSELIRPGLAVRVDPVRLLYLPLKNTGVSRNQLTIRGYCNEEDELKMMYQESDIIVLPSRTEGFGLVALEAISAGIPVLVAGETGIAEALHKVEGGKSVIVKSDKPKGWAEKIQVLSRQSPTARENSAKLLRENYNKTYSWSNECKKFERMINDLAESLLKGMFTKPTCSTTVEDAGTKVEPDQFGPPVQVTSTRINLH